MVAKKKKKPAANPARGFATTSIASKPKPDKNVELSDTPESGSTISPPIPVALENPTIASEIAKGNHQPTPEDLEEQLESDELQLLVEKYAAKIRRESSRQVSRIQTDQRVLRPQAQTVSTRGWLPDELIHEIIDFIKAETNDMSQRLGQQSLLKSISEDDATAKLWILHQVLNDLGISQDLVKQALIWLSANHINPESGVYVWGLQESLEWLALQGDDEQLLPYDRKTIKPGVAGSTESSRPGTPSIIHTSQVESPDVLEIKKLESHRLEATAGGTSTPTESDHSEVTVSDLESDLEPDELVSTYLSIKARLFDISPESIGLTARRSREPLTDKLRISLPAKSSSAVRKLQAQLRKIEADALFDKYDADHQWTAKRNQLAQESAARRRLRLEDGERGVANGRATSNSGHTSIEEVTSSAAQQPNDLFSKDSEDDFTDGGLLGEMFSATGEGNPLSPAQVGQTTADLPDIRLRDFGKQNGLSPRRVLEESIRARLRLTRSNRDPEAKLSYKLVSSTTYSCRHSLTICWTKDQDIVYDFVVPGVHAELHSRSMTFTATTVSTPSTIQSEGYISTAALFSLFSPSIKEEKTYLRLPSVWRDLYKEFLDIKKEQLNAADRATVRELRSIIQEQIEHEESQGVVLTNRFRKRNQGSGAVSEAEDSSRGDIRSTAGSNILKELWKQKTSTLAYQHMLVSRSSLPIFGFRDAALATIDRHQVTIICGETGCGKSTQLPAFLLENELSNGRPCKIYCTEPRRISAISLAQRVSEELGEFKNDLGTSRSLVGYAIRLESNTSAQTRLIYATVGIVLRMLESSQRLSDITHLIIDEIHERRSLMLRRPELKVVLMSATVDAQRFSRYLNDAPILNVPGRTFPVQTKYLEDAVELTHYTKSADEGYNDSDTSENDDVVSDRVRSGIPKKLPGYSNATRNTLTSYDEYRIDYDIILRLIEHVSYDPSYNQYSKAFLVFLPGIAEIRQLNDMLLVHPSFARSWLVYPLHSTISSEDQQQAFLIPPPGVKKIVLATNIAETGVTIPDITCVVDTGKHKEMRFDERRQLSRLTQSFISRANAKQRRGRAGRVQEGLCFHLFTKFRHDELMAEQQTPEMLRLSLQDLVMRTKICELGDIAQTLSEALDPPSSKNIRRAIDALIEVNALTSGEELTPLGRQLAKLPLDAHLGKLVLLSGIFSCVDVAITIAAILSSKSPFVTPLGARQRADAARLAFKRGDSDLLTAYNAYKTWKTVCVTPGISEMQFCHKNFLSSQNLSNIEDLKSQLLTSLDDAGFVHLPPDSRRALSQHRSPRHRTFVNVPASSDQNSPNDVLVSSVIAAAFYPRILIRDGKGWRNIANNQSVSLAPTAVNKGTTMAKFLSYYHIMQSSNKFYNAHSTSIAYVLPMILLAGSDADFRLHAGVISLNNNALKFAVKDWKTMIALKALRNRVRDIVNAAWKNPGKPLGIREEKWMRLFVRVFDLEQEKSERIEKAKVKGKGPGR
ncbi:ATP-dependent RNA helicase A [Cenococcum geophilum 1.58]|uniref:ATP-dependent RNA helicase A n=1 Tax=Cenococcum geophilum 1.58 TaxID=794803 RepID=A0ACC8EM19_9PEZI|nr:ATP-dependent RNA helicase A [Cenococcum geophilum 1.58]